MILSFKSSQQIPSSNSTNVYVGLSLMVKMYALLTYAKFVGIFNLPYTF